MNRQRGDGNPGGKRGPTLRFASVAKVLLDLLLPTLGTDRGHGRQPEQAQK